MTFRSILLATLLGVSLVSCIRQPVEEEVPATPEEVEQALDKALGELDPYAVRPQEFVFEETTLRIDSVTNPYFVLQEAVTFSDIVDDPERPTEYLRYNFVYSHRTIEQGVEGASSSRNQYFTLPKETSTLMTSAFAIDSPEKKAQALSEATASDRQYVFGVIEVLSLLRACYPPENLAKSCQENYGTDQCEVSCRNLTVEETLDPVPDLIKAQPDCGGFADCKIRNKKVSFDWVLKVTKDATASKQIVNFSATMSPDLPFLGRLTDFCVRQLLPVSTSGQKLLVTQCRNLKNYKPGTP